MPTNTRKHTETPGVSGDIPSEHLFAAFSDRRRQYALAYLTGKAAAITVQDLAEYIVFQEGRQADDHTQRVLTDLYHSHLPLLKETGLVAFNVDTERVDLRVDADVLVPYVRLTGLAVG